MKTESTNKDFYSQRIKSNALRLAYALRDYSDEYRKVKQLAEIMDYSPAQLQEDMQDISEYIKQLEILQEKSENQI